MYGVFNLDEMRHNDMNIPSVDTSLGPQRIKLKWAPISDVN